MWSETVEEAKVAFIGCIVLSDLDLPKRQAFSPIAWKSSHAVELSSSSGTYGKPNFMTFFTAYYILHYILNNWVNSFRLCRIILDNRTVGYKFCLHRVHYWFFKFHFSEFNCPSLVANSFDCNFITVCCDSISWHFTLVVALRKSVVQSIINHQGNWGRLPFFIFFIDATSSSYSYSLIPAFSRYCQEWKNSLASQHWNLRLVYLIHSQT